MTLYAYRLTHDTGFAPNPFHGVLTLATCKPGMRRTKKEGQWIAGFSSATLSQMASRNGVSISRDALIYLARITIRLTLAEYYSDARFGPKIPPQNRTSNSIACSGDNIYTPDPREERGFSQISQINHSEADIDRDLRGQNVLICEEYYYLGCEGRDVPSEIVINVPKGPSNYGSKTDSPTDEQKLLSWVQSNFGHGLVGRPCLWNEFEASCSGCSS